MCIGGGQGLAAIFEIVDRRLKCASHDSSPRSGCRVAEA
jgi:hypothetical protein